MDTERRDQVFERALALTPPSRKAFVDEACAGDEELRRNVHRLLDIDEACAGSLLDGPHLQPDEKVGRYRVRREIGHGGMSQVYEAEDTEIGRAVALKIVHSSAADPSAKAFAGEMRLLGRITHDHVVRVYDVGEHHGAPYLILELLEGETLADAIAAGRTGNVASKLAIALQVAIALRGVHEAGIIHRDIKPANVFLESIGRAKLLDFGIAQFETTHPSGIATGTPGYIAPERMWGATTAASDVYSYGMLLFELFAGQTPFTGEPPQLLLAAAVAPLPMEPLRSAGIPDSLIRLIVTLTAKDPATRPSLDVAITGLKALKAETDGRSEHGGAALVMGSRLELQSGDLCAAVPEETGVTLVARTVPIWRRALPWAFTAALAAAVTGALVLWVSGRRALPTASLRVSAELGAAISLRKDWGPGAVPSPDGQTLVFASEATSAPAMLYVRPLAHGTATPLAGTEEAANPFFSPDGDWIGFFAGGKLRRISIKGGTAITMCDAPTNGRGGSFFEDGSVVFGHALSPVLLRVSSEGGKPEPLTSLVDGEISHRWPQVLPGNGGVLYTSNTSDNWDEARIMVQPLPSGAPKLVQLGLYGRYVPSGHLLYVRGGTLYAAPFELSRLQVTGPSVSAVEDIVAGVNTGGAQFSVSETGTLVFLEGQGYSSAAPMALMDRAGNTVPLRSTRVDWGNPRFSPDGKHLAMDINDGKQTDIWVQDLITTKVSQLTLNSANDYHPTWTPDSRRIAFTSTRGGAPNIYWQRADGVGDAERLTRSPHPQLATSWHPGGRSLAIQEERPQTGRDIMILSLGSDLAASDERGRTAVFAANAFSEAQPVFSPDGRWVSYQSNETGHAEVFVRSVHAPRGKWRVSTGGGRDATWSRTKPELVYLSTTQDRIMVVPYTVTADAFQSQGARPWSSALVHRPVRRGRKFDLHPDGERVVIVPAEQHSDHVTMIFNFFDELRRLAPSRRRTSDAQ